MSNHKKAPVGSSHKVKDSHDSKEPKLGKLHKSGKTVPSWNSERLDKMSEHKGSGGVKK